MRGVLQSFGVLSTFLLMLSPSRGAAQQVPAVPRDGGVRQVDTAAMGTGAIMGRVVTSDAAPHSVRRATVTLSSAALTSDRLTMSDDDGRFVFEGLPAGRFTIATAKPSFVTSYYRSKRPGHGPGVPIALGDGQRVDDVQVVLATGAVLTGTITDEAGRAWPGIPVSVLESRMIGGERALIPVGLVRTDDRGVYRAYGLAPGTYFLAANAAGIGFDGIRGLTEDDFRSALGQVDATRPSASVAPSNPPVAPGKMLGYAPVLYPGTADLSDAVPTTLAVGEERTGLDFRLVWVPTANVSGTVTTADGSDLQDVRVSMVSNSQRFGFSQLQPVATTVPIRAGTFSIGPLAPGRYTLYGRAAPRAAAADAKTVHSWWAMVDVDVNGKDLEHVAVVLRPGVTLQGRLAFHGSAPGSGEPASAFQVRLTTLSSAQLVPAVEPARVRDDATFALQGITPGRYRIDVSGPTGARWALESAMFGADEVLDAGLLVRDVETPKALALTLTDHPTVLSGALTDPLNRPAPEYKVVVCSADKRFWTTDARRTRVAQPATDGRYLFTGLPPGDYLVAAVTDVDASDLNDAAFLELLAAAAVRITLSDGEARTLDLRLGIEH